MEEQKTNEQTTSLVRLFGILTFIAGAYFMAKAQLMEISAISDYDNFDTKSLIELPKTLADKTNFTILGGFLIVIGLQLSMITNKVVTEIKNQFNSQENSNNNQN